MKLSIKIGRCYLDMCADLGYVVLNSRTEGDEDGEITFIGDRGGSVVDIAAVPLDYTEYVSNFSVIPQVYSDHLLIMLKLELHSINNDNQFVLLPRLCGAITTQNNIKIT